MKITDSIILNTTKGDEYRIMLVEPPLGYLSDAVQLQIKTSKVDIREIIIERIRGGNVTNQKVLHQISNWLAGAFAFSPNMILFYQCDDMNPIPSRNAKSSNNSISVQEYRSRLFTRLFNTYIKSHQMEGIYNYPIRIDGEGYSYFAHIIARNSQKNLVDSLRKDIFEGFGK